MPPYRRITGAATQQRIRATLRTALNAAITRQLLTFNPASFVELESGKRPRALLWTPQQVAHWRETGERPGAVMVWSPEQIGAYLDAADESRLCASFRLLAFRGLRRGEGAGLPWAEVDLDSPSPAMTVVRTIVVGTDGWTPVEETPKTEDAAATIALDSLNVTVLRAHRRRRDADRARLGAAWVDTGNVFTEEDGSWLHPEKDSDEHRHIIERAGLPPVSLRDVRHAAAGPIHRASGGDIHAVKEVLRHSTIQLTSNTYTPLLRELDQENAERAALLVPRSRRSDDSGTDAHAPLTQEPLGQKD
jgi:integrase